MSGSATAAGLLYGIKDPKTKTWRRAGVLPDRVGEGGAACGSSRTSRRSLRARTAGQRDSVYAHLRTVYDGWMTRAHSRCPIPLEWHGRVVILGVCTSAIDNFSAYGGELGTRLLYVRLKPASQSEKRFGLRESRDKRREMKAIQEVVRLTVEEAALRLPTIVVSDSLAQAIDEGAIVASYGRVSVPRDGYRRHVTGLAEVEEPYRLRNQLTALARCSLALGLTDSEVAGLVSRIARDSMAQVRRDAIRAVLDLNPENIDGGPFAIQADAAITARIARDSLRSACRSSGARGPGTSRHDRQRSCRPVGAVRRARLDGDRRVFHGRCQCFQRSLGGRRLRCYHHLPPDKGRRQWLSTNFVQPDHPWGYIQRESELRTARSGMCGCSAPYLAIAAGVHVDQRRRHVPACL